MPVIYAVPVFDIFLRRAAHDWLWWYVSNLIGIRMHQAHDHVHLQVHAIFLVCWSRNHHGTGDGPEHECGARPRCSGHTRPPNTRIQDGELTQHCVNGAQGMLCGWAFLSPLSKQLGWAPGPVSSSSDGARGWILWPALAIMTAESILSVSFVAAQALRPVLARTAARAKSGHLFVRAEGEALDSDDDDDDDDIDSLDGLRVGGDARARRAVAREHEEPSVAVVVVGAALSCISCVLFVSAVFGEDGIKWWATVIALILASAFAILG